MCTCECKAPWTEGPNCEKCGLLPTDCHHGTVPDFENCTCAQPDTTSVWKGETGDTCALKAAACLHGGVLDQATCACTQCDEPWAGTTCAQCMRMDADCKQGAKIDEETCTCTKGCPTWGELCQRCPKGPNGEECSGRGGCDGQGICECDVALYDGDACEIVYEEATCAMMHYGDITTFDNAEINSWKGRGEVRMLERTLRDGTKESVHAIVAGSIEPVSAAVGVAVRRTPPGKEAATVMIVGQTGAAVTLTTVKANLKAGKTEYLASSQGDAFLAGVKAGGDPDDSDTPLVSVSYTGLGYVITTAGGGLEVTLESWNAPGAHDFQAGDHDRQFFDIRINARLAKTGASARGGCGNFDGNSDNDFGIGDVAGVQQSGGSHMACNQVQTASSLFQVAVADVVGGVSNAGANSENIQVNGIGNSGGAALRFKSPPAGAIQEAGMADVATSSSIAATAAGSVDASAGAEIEKAEKLTEASLAQRQLCSGVMLKEAVAACAGFVPVDFPTKFTAGSPDLIPLMECYFFSCQHDAALKGGASKSGLSQQEVIEAVRLGVSHAGRKKEQSEHHKKCLLPKVRAEQKAARPPQSLAMLASRMEELEFSDKCPK